MKKIYIPLLILLSLFTSCEEVVDIDVPSSTPKLVIDASFEVHFNKTPVTSNSFVKLSLSTDYFEETIPVVTNATVFITNLSDSSIINFNDDDLDGNYEPNTTFIPLDDTEYELTVIYKNETYKATATKIKSSPLTSVAQGDKSLFTGDEIELKVAFSDEKTREDYYLFDIDNFNFVPIEDRFFNGTDYNFSYFYSDENLELPKTVTVKLQGISKDYYDYFRILLDQSGVNGGGPFQTIPSLLLGNVINTTNENNFPLGYFHISETDTFKIKLLKK